MMHKDKLRKLLTLLVIPQKTITQAIYIIQNKTKSSNTTIQHYTN